MKDRCLESNLRFLFRIQNFDDVQAEQAVKQTSAMIDGVCLGGALSENPQVQI